MTKRRIALEPRKWWTAAEDEILRQRVPYEPTAVVAAAIGRSLASTYQRIARLGVKKSAEYLASPAAGRTNGRQGIGTRFVKGQAPPNKGIAHRPGWAPGRMAAHQFKPGCRQGIAVKNWKPIGTILTDSEGYLRIKVREAVKGEAYGFGNVRVWPLMQRHVWSQAHGPIPPNHTIAFKDRNRSNCAIENLECISRRELMLRNTIHNLPPELKETVQLLGRVNRQIRKREKHGEEQNNRPS